MMSLIGFNSYNSISITSFHNVDLISFDTPVYHITLVTLIIGKQFVCFDVKYPIPIRHPSGTSTIFSNGSYQNSVDYSTFAPVRLMWNG